MDVQRISTSDMTPAVRGQDGQGAERLLPVGHTSTLLAVLSAMSMRLLRISHRAQKHKYADKDKVQIGYRLRDEGRIRRIR